MKTIAKTFLLTLITLSFSIGVSAATFFVNTTGDTVDLSPGDGNCVDAGGNCLLRVDTLPPQCTHPQFCRSLAGARHQHECIEPLDREASVGLAA